MFCPKNIVVNFHYSLYYVWACLCKATSPGLTSIRLTTNYTQVKLLHKDKNYYIT